MRESQFSSKIPRNLHDMSASKGSGEEWGLERDKGDSPTLGTSAMNTDPQNLETTPDVQEPQDSKPEEPLEGPSTSHALLVIEPELQAPVMPKTSRLPTSASHRRQDARQQQSERRRRARLGSKSWPFKIRISVACRGGVYGKELMPPI